MRPFGVEPEYLALVEPETLEPIDTLAGDALLALAARIGEVRLIDNTILSPAATQTPSDTQVPAATHTSQPLEGEAIATCSA
jgi:pantoate--beta-alanine ligase